MGVELVDSDLPEEVRRNIAWLFVHDFELDEARRDALRDVRRKAKEQPIVDALDAALAWPDKLPPR